MSESVAKYLGTVPKGDVITPLVIFLDANGYPVTPTVVTLVTRTPAAVQTTYTLAASEIEANGTGYSKDLQVSEVGTWRLKWSGTITGLGVRVVEQYFTVASSSIT